MSMEVRGITSNGYLKGIPCPVCGTEHADPADYGIGFTPGGEKIVQIFSIGCPVTKRSFKVPIQLWMKYSLWECHYGN